MSTARLRDAAETIAAIRRERAEDAADRLDLDDPVERVAENAGKTWRDEALRVVEQYAREHAYFTVEEIAPLVPPAIDRRALGWVMRRAAQLHYIEHEGFVKSGRERHNKPTVQWRSLLIGAGP